jgi:hypothetical protein
MEGFAVKLDDAGGRTGASGGQVSHDFFGNPLGTTYRPCTAAEIAASECPYPGERTVDMMGTGVLKTDAFGRCVIQNLAPGFAAFNETF